MKTPTTKDVLQKLYDMELESFNKIKGFIEEFKHDGFLSGFKMAKGNSLHRIKKLLEEIKD